MQVSRFKRELEIRTSAFVFLNQEYELAKLESLKDVPIVRILDAPTLPDKKVYPSRSLFLILITIITSMLTCFGIIIYESINKVMKSRENEFENELSDILKSTAKRVNRFVNIFSKKDKVDI